jgi:hypothetical protein
MVRFQNKIQIQIDQCLFDAFLITVLTRLLATKKNKNF